MPNFNRFIKITIIVNNQKITINDFKITVIINKTEKPDSNTANITIYGLNDNTKNFIDNEDAFLICEAGYIDGSGSEIIFQGDIKKVTHEKQKPESFTLIEVNDGYKNIKNNKINFSFDSGVTANTILDKASKALGLPIKNLPIISGIKNIVFNQGYNYGGKVSDLLDNITEDLDLLWNVQNNELKVYDEDGSDQSVIVSLNRLSGLIGSPKQIKITRGKNKTPQKGYNVTSFCQPLIEPGGRVSITSREIPTSVFKVISVNHTLDNTEGDFLTTMEVIQ